MTLPVSEVFGPTFQGEGPHAGRRCYFIRLGGCNLSCSWCDTPYTWDGERYDLREQLQQRDVGQVVLDLLRLGAHSGDLVVLSGGEPLLYQDRHDWAILLGMLLGNELEVHVETNGTIAPNDVTLKGAAHFSVSPKLQHAGDHKGRSAAPALAWAHVDRAILKVVCKDAADVRKAVRLWCEELPLVPRARMWVMPEGTTSQVLAARWPAIVEAAVAAGINASHRLHVLAWEDERGR